MSQQTSDFIEALHKLEQSEDPSQISNLFSDNAQLSNPLTKDDGSDASSFWKNYRGSFEKVQSEFMAVVEGDGTAMLEWSSSGTIEGQPFSYSGVSVLEFEGGKIKTFRAYFDPRQLVAHTMGGGHSDHADVVPEDAQREAAEQRAAGGYS